MAMHKQELDVKLQEVEASHQKNPAYFTAKSNATTSAGNGEAIKFKQQEDKK